MNKMNSVHGSRFWFGIIKLICLPTVLLVSTGGYAIDSSYLVYVGTYTGKESKGIYVYRFDPATGESGSIGLAAATDNPSFLAVDPNNRFLYATNELDTFHNESTGAISTFAIDRKSGKLTLLQQVSSLGGGPTHLSLDKSAKYLMVANYTNGSAAVFPIKNDGRLGPHSAFVQNAGSSVNPNRQTGPHAHSIQVTSDNRFAMVADLGLDKLLVYRFNAGEGSLTSTSFKSAGLAPGAGPRHIALPPSGKFVYVVNEMASTVTVFAYEPSMGKLTEKQTISTLEKKFAGENFAAEILVDSKGRFLYVSNRGDDSIAVFSIHPDSGNLTPLEWISSGGKTPRNIAIDPTGKWMFAANQNSNDITLFRIDSSNGRLMQTSRSFKVPSPICIGFVPVK
jgi:6-phosphogluconolactonase